MDSLTIDILKDLLSYDKDTGIFTWKVRDVKYCKSIRDMNRWNNRHAGKIAGCNQVFKNGKPYTNIIIFYKKYYSHRLAWFYCNGEWPKQIDHINGNGLDNRISNLRNVDDLENSKNRRLPSNNSSGVTGVHWHKRMNRWQVIIGSANKKHHIGTFLFFDDAVNARNIALKEYKFHENHGTNRNL